MVNYFAYLFLFAAKWSCMDSCMVNPQSLIILALTPKVTWYGVGAIADQWSFYSVYIQWLGRVPLAADGICPQLLIQVCCLSRFKKFLAMKTCTWTRAVSTTCAESGFYLEDYKHERWSEIFCCIEWFIREHKTFTCPKDLSFL